MNDPASYFAAIAAEHPRCFWLDGGGAREWSGRRSIIGWLGAEDESLSYFADRREVVLHAGGTARVVGEDIFDVLAERIGAGEQWFGYFGYAARPDLPAASDGWVPDAVWMRPESVRVFDHGPPSEVSRLVASAPRTSTTEEASGASTTEGSTTGQSPSEVEVRAQRASKPRPPSYDRAFARVQEHLHAGNSYEVNLTHRVERTSDLDPVSAYLRLRAVNPAPYSGFLQHDVPGARAWLLSSSPERYAVVRRDRTLETKPIKGTTPRGATPGEDDAQRDRLASEAKTRAENLMIVDLLRNDLSGVCEVGSVDVPTLMEVETYASVHQLVSTVRGRLREGVSTIEALRALFPAGSMTGAPKLRTMQIIDEVEETPRGVYSGAFGWISGNGAADLGVVIRSLVTDGSGTWRLGTGGGITVKSDVAEEWAESQWKAERLLRVFD